MSSFFITLDERISAKWYDFTDRRQCCHLKFQCVGNVEQVERQVERTIGMSDSDDRAL